MKSVTVIEDRASNNISAIFDKGTGKGRRYTLSRFQLSRLSNALARMLINNPDKWECRPFRSDWLGYVVDEKWRPKQ